MKRPIPTKPGTFAISLGRMSYFAERKARGNRFVVSLIPRFEPGFGPDLPWAKLPLIVRRAIREAWL